MVRGPTKGSKRYTCRNKACEKFGKVQYLAPWVDKRCRHCGSKDIEEVTTRVGEKLAPPGLPVETGPQEPPATPQEPPAEPPSGEADEAKVGDEEKGLATEDKIAEPPASGVGAPPEPKTVTTVKPKNGDLVRCKKCNWAVYWDDQYHKKPACHAAGCGSSDIEIKRPVEGT